MDERDVRNGTVGREAARELAGSDAELALKDGEAAAGVARNAQAEVSALRQLLQRIEQQQLAPEDWALLGALIQETYDDLESSNAPITF